MQHSSRGRYAAVLSLAVVALFALTGVASASTLTADGTRLVWTADDGIANSVTIDDPAADTIEISTSNDPIEEPLPANCTDTDGDPAAPHDEVTCTGYTGGTFNAGDMDDFINAESTGDNQLFPVIIRGGDGSDDLRGGWANDEVYGEGGNDNWVTGDNSGPSNPGGDDIVDGGAGDDSFVSGGRGNDTVTGGDGDDDLRGGQGNDTLDGGADDDYIAGAAGADTVNGGDGDDEIDGGCNGECGSSAQDEADVLDGGAGNDDVDGELGNDTVRGGAGDDYVRGGFGDDNVDGGDGDDFLGQDEEATIDETNIDEAGTDPGNDTWSGGAGIDTINYTTNTYRHGESHDFEDCVAEVDVNLSQDGVANDGREGEADNLGSDIENVSVYNWCTDTEAGIVGDANVSLADGTNALSTDEGDDTANGGAGNDFISTEEGNDTINAVDGFADRVDCGEDDDSLNDDADVANVDEFDQVASNCETVNLTRLNRFATEDAQPTVSWVNPATDGVTLSNGANTLTVNATDDKGIAQVIFLAGSEVVCTDTAAPYECSYTPDGDDVGETTLVALAIDSSQQVSTALRFVEINRFEADGLTFKVSPKKDKSFPLKFRASGKVELPAGITPEEGCKGRVTTRWKVGKKTISTRSAKVKPDCTWSVRNKFGEKYRITAGKLRIFARFQGNDVLEAEKAKTRKVKVAKGS